jgi:hypothetical protein
MRVPNKSSKISIRKDYPKALAPPVAPGRLIAHDLPGKCVAHKKPLSFKRL